MLPPAATQVTWSAGVADHESVAVPPYEAIDVFEVSVTIGADGVATYTFTYLYDVRPFEVLVHLIPYWVLV